MVLAHCGLGTPVLYHRNGGYGLLARSVVVRPCLSARQHVHEVAVPILSPSVDTSVCAHLWFSPVVGHRCLRLIRHWHVFRLGRPRGNWRCVLADDCRHHPHRHSALFRLCADDVVQLLPDRVVGGMGRTEEVAIAKGFCGHSCGRALRSNMPDVCPCMPHAAETL